MEKFHFSDSQNKNWIVEKGNLATIRFLKFIYSEKATKFYEIAKSFDLCTVVKSKGKISQNFEAFSEYMNFRRLFGVLVQIQLSQKQTGLQKNTHCWDSRILK